MPPRSKRKAAPAVEDDSDDSEPGGGEMETDGLANVDIDTDVSTPSASSPVVTKYYGAYKIPVKERYCIAL